MDTNISLIDATSNVGFSPSNGPFWAVAMQRWVDRHDGDDFAFLSKRFSTDSLDHKLYKDYKILLRGTDRNEQIILVEDDEKRLVQFSFYESDHGLNLYIYSPLGMADAEQLMHEFESMIPARIPKGEQWVNVAFWTLAPNGQASLQDRDIEANSWEEVKGNYPNAETEGRSIRSSLDELHQWEQPPDRGRLMLLHGPAGTGKTRALACLARSWKTWCSVHYVVDPDRFFGSAHYMMSVLLDSGHHYQEKARWRLIIVEDADELLSSDAKHRKGQDVSRLLNLCDGLIGQGLRVLVLITTNEEVGKMHPAIIRSGRCVANLHVGKFSMADANVWRLAHNLKPVENIRNGGGVTLAELYEELTQSQVLAGNLGPKRIGF